MRILAFVFIVLFKINSVVENSNIFQSDEQTITAINGSEAMLKCYIMVNLNYSQFLNVSWIKSPRQILTRGFFRVTENNRFHLQQPAILNTQIFNLRISPVLLEDEGQYRCNFIYGRKIFAKVVSLIIQVPPKMKKHPSPLIKVDEGKSFKLSCMAIGKPDPWYTWFAVIRRDEETNLISIPYSIGKYDTDISISDGNLTVHKSNRHMRGIYRCQAQNKIGLIHWDTKVLVLYPPEIFMSNEVITQSLHQNTVIVCTLSSYPLGVVTWHFDPGNVTLKTILCGIINENSMKYCMMEQRPNSENGEVKLISKLTLFRLTKEEFGSYVCQSKTILGSATGVTQLKMTNMHSKDEDGLTPEDRAFKSLRDDQVTKYRVVKPEVKLENDNLKIMSHKSLGQSQKKNKSRINSTELFVILVCTVFALF